MTQRSRCRVAFAGAGFIAEYHAAAISQVDNTELVAVCDLNTRRAETFARMHGVMHVFHSLDAMMKLGDVDVIHILLPPDQHYRAAERAMSAGMHVFVEKPLCTNVDECHSLLAEAARRRLSLGVNHNFLFYTAYERLRSDVRSGVLGPVDYMGLTWQVPLACSRTGPYDVWMLRDPENIVLEIGSHLVACMLDLASPPRDLRIRATDPFELPTHRRFYRRWQVLAECGGTAVDLHLAFGYGFPERAVCVRGALGGARADLLHDVYLLDRGSRYTDAFGHYHRMAMLSRSLRKQARANLGRYVLSRLKVCRNGNAFEHSIARSVRAFYATIGQTSDDRNAAWFGSRVVEECVRIAVGAGLRAAKRPLPLDRRQWRGNRPETLVLGGTGFIGRELVRQLLDAGRTVRVMSHSGRGLAFAPDGSRLEVVRGDILEPADVSRAIDGVRYVFHLARARGRSWREYFQHDVLVTKRIAELCLRKKVERFIYTGTISSYYAGARGRCISDDTPLDPSIARRDAYSRAKAVSEEILLRMHEDRDLPVVIFRPGIVIGTGGDPCHWGVGLWTGLGVCQLWGDGRNELPFVLVEDVASALIAGLRVPGIEGQVFNLVGDVRLSATEYIRALEDQAGIRIQAFRTPIWRFYFFDILKSTIKALVKHNDRRWPSYRDWRSRTARSTFDCSKAKSILGWRPVSDVDELVARGIGRPVQELLM